MWQAWPFFSPRTTQILSPACDAKARKRDRFCRKLRQQSAGAKIFRNPGIFPAFPRYIGRGWRGLRSPIDYKEKIMLKKYLSIALAAFLIIAPLGAQPVAAGSRAEKEAKRAEKVKAGVNKLGVGKASRIAVKLRDKTKLVGYVSEIKEDSFTITEPGAGKATVVPYPDVTQVKGHNLSTGAKIAVIGLSAAVAMLAFFLWLENAD
jgi:hypothetical protein